MFFLKFCFGEAMTKSRMFRQAKQIFRQSGRQKYKEYQFRAYLPVNCDRHIEKEIAQLAGKEVHRMVSHRGAQIVYTENTDSVPSV